MATPLKPRPCRKCQNQIPTSVVVDGKTRRLHPRKYCLACSPWGSRNCRKLELIRTDGLKKCRGLCQKELSTKKFSGTNGTCNDCYAEKLRVYRLAMKKRCVDYLGGRCARCPYRRCLAALDFHHRDGSKKEFEIGRYRWKDFERLKSELDKCILLCRNCHAEEHSPQEYFLDMPDHLSTLQPLNT